jgi:mono/diheme cytochrome c family protein
MKRAIRISLIVICLLGLTAGLAITFTIGWRSIIGPRTRALTGRHFESTPARMARGEYLVRNVALCLTCHSPHDWKAAGMPILPGMDGAGEIFPDRDMPGQIVAPNLTPDPETGAGKWTDDQLARAIREGIGHDGRALFPLMPYPHFRELPDEDLASIIVYIRALAPVRNPLPKTEIIFPVKYLIRSVPQPLDAGVTQPSFATQESRGAYLVNLAICGECHTPADRGKVLEGREFSGGQKFNGPWGTITSANITPDPSGISYYDEKLFLEAMRTGKVGARSLSAFMPWKAYGNMTDEDLKAIFAYLRTLKPVQNRVDNTAPTGQQ